MHEPRTILCGEGVDSVVPQLYGWHTRARLHWPAGVTHSSDLSSTHKARELLLVSLEVEALDRMRDTEEGMEFYLACSDGGRAEALWKGHPGKSYKGSFLSQWWCCPWASWGWTLHTEDPHSQSVSVYSGQEILYTAGNSNLTNVGQLAHPGEPPPLNFTWLQVGKQRSSILLGCGGSSRLIPT